MSESEPAVDPVDVDGVVRSLRDAADRLERRQASVEEVGEAELERLAERHGAFTDLLDTYEPIATGSGREEFQAYVEFQEELVGFIERLPADLPAREAFEAAEDVLDQRRLTEGDFADAREALAPATDLVERLDAREEALEAYRSARHRVRDRRRELDRRIEELERIAAYGDLDLDADVTAIEAPITTYNEAVRDAFETFRRERPARDVVGFVADAADRPLVGFEAPPEPLLAYLESAPAGEEPVPRLLEYAEYTRSKLAHYVEDPQTFRGRVAANRTYLDRLDAEPVTVAWPPPPADELRWRARELVGVVDRFAPEEAVTALRRVRDRARSEAYPRLRRIAEARASLTDEERRRLASGAVDRELEAARAARSRLADALEEHPRR